MKEKKNKNLNFSINNNEPENFVDKTTNISAKPLNPPKIFRNQKPTNSLIHSKTLISIKEPMKFSTLLREIDFNSYRTTKLALDDFENQNQKEQNHNIKYKKENLKILNNKYNLVNAPFGNKTKRFKWQTNKNYFYMLEELKGKTKKYLNKNNSESCENINNNKKIKNNFAHNFWMFNNLNTKRIIEPQKDLIPNLNNHQKKKKILRNSSTGSIINLIEKTPLYIIPKTRNKITEDNKIFSKEFFTYNDFKKSKKSVDLNKYKKMGYAG